MANHYDNAPASDKDGNLTGFDAEFSDIVDYILRITYRIWEGKQVGLCYDYYSADCPVYTLAGYTEGAEQVANNTISTLASFPDRTLDAANIVWGGNAEDGFHTSHLIRTKMTNFGASEFGVATGKSAEILVIAHCVVKDNRVIKEWLVRDNYSLAQQLGIDPQTHAQNKALVPIDPDSRYASWYTGEIRRLGNQDRSRQNYPENSESDAELWISAALQNIWNAKLIGDCNLLYSTNAVLHVSAREDRIGIEQIQGLYIELLGAIPDAKVSCDYLCSNSMLDDDIYVAARWTLAGIHSGSVPWGEPTGQALLILGESQYRIHNRKVVEEWMVFDELAVITQINRYRLAHSSQAKSLAE